MKPDKFIVKEVDKNYYLVREYIDWIRLGNANEKPAEFDSIEEAIEATKKYQSMANFRIDFVVLTVKIVAYVNA